MSDVPVLPLEMVYKIMWWRFTLMTIDYIDPVLDTLDEIVAQCREIHARDPVYAETVVNAANLGVFMEFNNANQIRNFWGK